MKTKYFTLAALVLAPVALFAQTATSTMVGGDRDSHGCIPSAGYVWSEAQQKCVRPWENNLNVTCIQSALDKRENSLSTAHDAFNTAVKNALAARLTALKASYAQTAKDARKTSRNEAHKQFKNSLQSAHTTLRSAKNSAWNTFSTEMKACGVKHDERAQSVVMPSVSL